MGRWADRIRLRMRSLLHGRTVDVELARELRDHIEQQILENLEAGMNPGDARAAAHRAFGSIPSIEEQCRDTRRVAWIENLCPLDNTCSMRRNRPSCAVFLKKSGGS